MRHSTIAIACFALQALITACTADVAAGASCADTDGAALLQQRHQVARSIVADMSEHPWQLPLQPSAIGDDHFQVSPEPEVIKTEAPKNLHRETLYTESLHASSKVKGDVGHVLLELDGQTHSFELTRADIYGSDGAVLVHSQNGVQRRKSTSHLFRSTRTFGAAGLHKDGSVSGVFIVGEHVLRVRPRTFIREASLLQGAASTSSSSHVAQRYQLAGLQHGKFFQRAFNETGSNETILPDPSPEEGAEDPTNSEPLPEERPWNGTSFFPGCYPEDHKLHIMKIGVGADVKAYQKWGDEVEISVEVSVLEVSYILEHQLNIMLEIAEFDIFQDDATAPSLWANSSCPGAPGDEFVGAKLYDLTDTRHGMRFAIYHLFTGCYGWPVIGMAWIPGICSTHNTAVNELDWSNAWHIMAHEIGHNLGMPHTDCEGDDAGGIMGWCDSGGYWEGEFSFNRALTFGATCSTITRETRKCAEGLFELAEADTRTGLLAEFFFEATAGASLSHKVPNLTRTDAAVNYTDVASWPQPSFGAVRWTGGVEISSDGTYHFEVVPEEGSTLFVDGLPVAAGDPLVLSSGLHSIVLEFFPASGQAPAEMFLKHNGPDSQHSMAVIPEAVLRPVAHGFNAHFFYGPSAVCNVPHDLGERTPDMTRVDAEVMYSNTGGTWPGVPHADAYTARWTTGLLILNPGTYTFETYSDDGSILFVDSLEAPLIDNDGCHAMVWKQSATMLTAGLHLIVIEYTEAGGGAGMEFKYKGPDTHGALVPPHSSRLFATVLPPQPTTTTTTTTTTVSATGGPEMDFGLKAEYFKHNGGCGMPPLDSLVPYDVQVDANVDFSTSFALWSILDLFAVRWTGFIEIATAGTYTFSTTSDDGSFMYVNVTEVVNNDGCHGMRTHNGAIYLEKGLHPVRVEFSEVGGGAGMIWEYSGPDTNSQKVVVPSSVLKHEVFPLQGLTGEFFAFDVCNGAGGSMPADWSSFGAPFCTRIDPTLDQEGTGSHWTGVSKNENYVARWTGGLVISSAGSYTFELTSDDGSFLYINGAELINNDGPHGMDTVIGKVHLEAGTHHVEVKYFECGGGAGIIWKYKGPDTSAALVTVPADVLLPEAPPLVPQGLTAQFFQFSGNCEMPDLDTLSPYLTRIDPRVSYSVVGHRWDKGVSNTDWFAARWKTILAIQTTGTYSFFVNIDDGATMSVNGSVIIEKTSPGIGQGSAFLESGNHSVELDFYECSGGAGIVWQYYGPDTGYATTTVPQSVLSPA